MVQLFSQELVPSSDSNLTRSLMYLFEMLMKEACAEEKTARENKNLKIWIVVRQSKSACYHFIVGTIQPLY